MSDEKADQVEREYPKAVFGEDVRRAVGSDDPLAVWFGRRLAGLVRRLIAYLRGQSA